MSVQLHRTHQCGKLTEQQIGETVVLNGWISKRRDLGGLIFADVRDRSGIVQIVFNEEFSKEAFAKADSLRSEFVVAVKGTVILRDPETVNMNLKTGTIEVQIIELDIINMAKNPPFFIQDQVEVDEMLRLKYRYLDLRRPEMLNNFQVRHNVTKIMRNFLDENEFMEVETPMLTKSTPEGARDYLVPSRVQPGSFFALPQSPQLFKQLLMVSGFERYFQIARCFRDEDLRADRQPEFTQVDIEMSFLPLSDFQTMMEQMMAKVMKEVKGIDIEVPFQRLSYDDAMSRYGSDKPDTRFALELVDITEIAASCSFKVFQAVAESKGLVKGINAKGCGEFSRKEIDDLTAYVARYGAKGLAWIAVTEDGIKSQIAKFFTEEELNQIVKAMNGQPGDLLLFVADKPKVVYDALGNLRLLLGKQLKLIDESKYNFLWVTDFPLVEWDADAKRYVALHHPFTMPLDADVPLLDTNPAQAKAKAYDMVLNGFEIGGGSMRIYQKDIQEKMFKLLGFTEEEAKEQFGFLLEAFEYGTPPHGGMAFGLDRLIMILTGRQSLRDCIAFPKTASATCQLTNAPSQVSNKQLKELHIKTIQFE
ncbi:aspartate--tRNA ligase [Desulfuribacillus stibiiarsenatis]|uniref:Aspartate--tRNA ligase n=1 Tax=Desulfuribacillus stibiiarsenatis TaxID=1390249 RepID=A0A1E5L3R6_9FIRM|nr:aspartate--tRNA ligase [Desulfuribacillus stibiiarsenatis]OEH84579.1 aspartate--tRNA ligase [Desulfuribacillus stibiiarsenatis]